MTKKIIHIDGVGSIELKKNALSKSLSIRIKPYEGVKVSVPKRMSMTQAEEVVKSKKQWILEHLPKIKALEKKATIYDENTFFQTKFHRLVIRQQAVEKLAAKLSAEELLIVCPLALHLQDETVQEFIQKTILFTLRKEAQTYLPKRTGELAEKFGFMYQKVSVKNTKSRWGSCSSKNNINLSLHLIRLPDELIDYVILHELAHTVQKNHSKDFWNLLEKVCPGSKKLDKKLNEHSLRF